MRLSKHGRSKKGLVAPMSDDEGEGNDREDLHRTSRQSDAFQTRQEYRGVSFTTPRGKLWLILIINLAIITAFIFMSSSRFPTLSGEGVVNGELEQDHQHPGPAIKHANQASTLAMAEPAVTEAAKAHESNHPGGYSKLTSTEATEGDLNLTDETQSETEILGVSSDEIPTDSPAEPIAEEENALNTESTVVLEPQETRVPASDVDPDTNSEFTKVDTSSAPASTESQRDQQSPDFTEPTSQIEESQPVFLDTSPPPQHQSVDAELSSTSSIPTPQSEDSPEVQPARPQLEVQPASNAFLHVDNLSVWLAADSGVGVQNLAMCLASSGDDVTACGVNSWTSQIVNADKYATDSTTFQAASPQQRPVWVPIVPDTHNQLPTVYFSCPTVTETVRVRESMTLLFVISPAQIEPGDVYTGQNFFGNSPYGQFSLHGGKPSFFANNGLVESNYLLPVGQFSLLTYRLHSGYVEIKVNGGLWGGESKVEGDTDERRVRITMNDVVSLGNSKRACDTNAFQGRIAEVLIYDAVLGDARVEAVEKYLHDKWWGDKPFPEPAVAMAMAATSEPDPVSEIPREKPTDDVLELDSSESERPSEPPHDEDTTDSPALHSAGLSTEAASESEPPAAEETLQTSMTEEPMDDDDDTTNPAPKFDPRINIFEWTPPSNGEAPPAKAEQWTRTVREKVNFIRNFQLGGDVLRELIRLHRDELLALREELFG